MSKLWTYHERCLCRASSIQRIIRDAAVWTFDRTHRVCVYSRSFRLARLTLELGVENSGPVEHARNLCIDRCLWPGLDIQDLAHALLIKKGPGG